MKTKSILFLLIFSFIGINISYSQIRTKPIAYFKLDGNANEEIKGNNGILHGNMSETTDRNGNKCGAMEFDGSSYIEVMNSTALSKISTKFSVSGWIYFNRSCNSDLFWGTIICKGNGKSETFNNPQYRLQFTKVTYSLRSEMDGKKGIVLWKMSSRFSYGRWHFFTSTYDGSEAKFYLDGSEVFSRSVSLRFNKNSAPLHIGRDRPGDDEYFCGKLDDLKIYNKVLSAKDVKKLYNYTPTTNCPGAIVNTTDPPLPVTPPEIDPPDPIVNTDSHGCTFPTEMSGVPINYASADYITNKKKVMIFATDTRGKEDLVYLCLNGKWRSSPIQLSDVRQYIHEGMLKNKCNYLVFKPVRSKAKFDVQINRKKYNKVECTKNSYWGVKIILE